MFKIIASILLTTLFLWTAVAGNAQESPASTSLQGLTGLPILSFVKDNSGGLRPLLGVPGAASVGTALNLGFGIVQAVAPPNHDYIVASTETGGPLWIGLHRGAMSILPMDSFMPEYAIDDPNAGQSPGSIEGLWLDALTDPPPPQYVRHQLAPIDRIVLSSTGSTAAFFSASAGRIYVFANMALSPFLLAEYDVVGLGAVAALGISDDGLTVAVGVSDGTAGSLYLVNSWQPPQWIAPMRHPSAIRFLRNSNDAIIADGADDTIYALASGHVYPVATAANGISGPVGIATSRDNQKVFVANSGTGSIITISSLTNIGEPAYCNCALSGLHPTNTDSVFRLTDFAGNPVVLFDGRAVSPRIIYASVKSEF